MNTTVKKIFILQVSLFLLSILIIAFFMFYMQAINNINNKAISDFNSELLIMSKDTNYKVLISKENTKALASRTMIRKSLFSYFNGETPLAKVRAYTEQKYIDGASVYHNIISAVRTDLDGKIIAEYNPENLVMPTLEEDEEILFIDTHEGCNIYIVEKIIHNNILIGHDSGLFFLDCFKKRETDLLKNISMKPTNMSNISIESYSSSYPIGDTSYFLHAEINQDTLRRDQRAVLKTVLVETVLLILAVFVISYFTIFRLSLNLIKKINSTNVLLEDSLDKKELLMREVHHRIKNNFASIGSLLSIQVQSINNSEAISILQDAIGRVESMHILYEKLLLTKDYQNTSVKDYLDNLIDEIISLFPENDKITVKKHINDYQINSKKLSPLGLIVNELLTNVMKYAFTGRDSGKIEVELKEDHDLIVLSIQDNGNGLPPGFDISKSHRFGLKLVEMLAEQLDGNFTIENNNGTKSILKFKIFQ